MQDQKDINKFVICSSTKIKRVASFFVLFAVILGVIFAVFISNTLFDRSLLSFVFGFSLNSPEESYNNGIVADLNPSVSCSIYNRGAEKIDVTTDVVTLGELLKNNNIEIDETCTLNYSLDTKVFEGMMVTVDSVTYEEITVNEDIPFEVKKVEVQSIPKSTTRVITEGQNGVSCNTYKKKYVNGFFDSQEILENVVTIQPVDEVVEVGVGGSFIGKDGVTYEYSYYLDVVATCYGEADGYSGSITATGTPARVGVIAVDPNTIPLGSKVFVTGDYRELGVCYAEDTGGYIKGNRIDVYLEGTLQQLLEFGRRNMRVYILE